MKIDRHIKALASKPPGELNVLAQARKSTQQRGDDDAIEMGIARDNRCGLRLNQIG